MSEADNISCRVEFRTFIATYFVPICCECPASTSGADVKNRRKKNLQLCFLDVHDLYRASACLRYFLCHFCHIVVFCLNECTYHQTFQSPDRPLLYFSAHYISLRNSNENGPNIHVAQQNSQFSAKTSGGKCLFAAS